MCWRPGDFISPSLLFMKLGLLKRTALNVRALSFPLPSVLYLQRVEKRDATVEQGGALIDWLTANRQLLVWRVSPGQQKPTSCNKASVNSVEPRSHPHLTIPIYSPKRWPWVGHEFPRLWLGLCVILRGHAVMTGGCWGWESSVWIPKGICYGY